MNPIKSHVAIVLLPLLVAACDAQPRSSERDASWLAAFGDDVGGEGGAGGEARGEGGADTTSSGETSATVGTTSSGEGSTSETTTASGESSTSGGEGGAGGQGGAGGDAGEGTSTGETTGSGDSTGTGEGASDSTGEGAGDSTGTGEGAGDSTGTGEGAGDSTGETTGSGETTGAGATTGTGGGIVMSPESDRCPGEAQDALVLDAAAIEIDGTTVGASDALDTCWTQHANDDGADRVFAFELEQPGVLTVVLEGSGDFEPWLLVRTDCMQDDYCHTIGDKREIHRTERAAGTVYVVVDSPAGTSGDFKLTARLTTPACGDGVLSGNEECDPGGARWDGCGTAGTEAACKEVAPAQGSGDSCDDLGAPIEVQSGVSVVSQVDAFQHTLFGFGDDAIGTCMPETGGPDRVFALMPQVTGRLTVRAGMDKDGEEFMCSADPSSAGCFDIEMFARSTCDSGLPEDELACESTCCDGETIEFDVEKDVPVYLFVDGYDQYWYSQGPFNLHFHLEADETAPQQ